MDLYGLTGENFAELTNYDQTEYYRIRGKDNPNAQHTSFDYREIFAICIAFGFTPDLTKIAVKKANLGTDFDQNFEVFIMWTLVEKYSGYYSVSACNDILRKANIQPFGRKTRARNAS